jgi:Tfp pilus assembly protein PilV
MSTSKKAEQYRILAEQAWRKAKALNNIYYSIGHDHPLNDRIAEASVKMSQRAQRRDRIARWLEAKAA